MEDARSVVVQVPSQPDRLELAVDFPNLEPGILFDYWTRPPLLARWWPPVAEIDLRAGGGYHLSWPEMDWHLRGYFLSVERGVALSFTWRWDSDPPEAPGFKVALAFMPLTEGGSKLMLVHGPYDDSPGLQEARAHHLEGWTHFLTRLYEVQSGG